MSILISNCVAAPLKTRIWVWLHVQFQMSSFSLELKNQYQMHIQVQLQKACTASQIQVQTCGCVLLKYTKWKVLYGHWFAYGAIHACLIPFLNEGVSQDSKNNQGLNFIGSKSSLHMEFCVYITQPNRESMHLQHSHPMLYYKSVEFAAGLNRVQVHYQITISQK